MTLEPTYSYPAVGAPHVQPFADLAVVLGGRDAAVDYVELGARAASYQGYAWAALRRDLP
jgi:hypothetical protein